MRLEQSEIDAIVGTISSFVVGMHAELRLYGSRVDDSKRGGDIDLLLLVDDEKAKELRYQKIDILAKLKSLIGDQKIDLLITERSNLNNDPFLQSIYSDSVVLLKFI